jgi:hypothetical protein
LNSGAIILLDDAGDHILEVLAQLGELLNALLNDLLGPLVDLVALVNEVVAANDSLDSVLSDLGNLLGVEVLIVFEFCHL